MSLHASTVRLIVPFYSTLCNRVSQMVSYAVGVVLFRLKDCSSLAIIWTSSIVAEYPRLLICSSLSTSQLFVGWSTFLSWPMVHTVDGSELYGISHTVESWKIAQVSLGLCWIHQVVVFTSDFWSIRKSSDGYLQTLKKTSTEWLWKVLHVVFKPP